MSPWPSNRPSARRPGASSAPRPITDDIQWTRQLDPPESYEITYADSKGDVTTRVIDLRRIGRQAGIEYLGAIDRGKFKTFRAENVRTVRQLTAGHPPSIVAFPVISYVDRLPAFPVSGAVYRIPTTAVSKRRWTVDLNRYTCSCPERRIRGAAGYEPGQLGFVCLHMSRAILEHLPKDANWPPALLHFLGSRIRVHIDSLV